MLFAAASLALSACGPTILYNYDAPATTEGKMCAQQCVNTKMYCEQSQQTVYQQCTSNYNMQMNNYNNCRRYEGNYCQAPPTCYAPNTWSCEENYRQCFTNCGGKVTATPIEKK